MWKNISNQPVEGVVEEGENLKKNVGVGVFEIIPNSIQDCEDNMKAVTIY